MGQESGHFVWGPSKVVFYTQPSSPVTSSGRKWGHLEAECEYLCIYFYFHVILSFPWISVCCQPRPWKAFCLLTGLGWGLGRGSGSLLTDISPTPCHPHSWVFGCWALIILLLILSLREQIKTLIITCLSAIFLPKFFDLLSTIISSYVFFVLVGLYFKKNFITI